MSTSVPGPIAVIDHYNLLERLEPSGPGDLFRARDTKKGRTVAVRILPRDFTTPAARSELMVKARALAALSHPNVTTLFDVGEHDGCVYLVFEFLKGQSLRSEMGGRPINVRRAVDLAVAMADAVADAHSCGYIHGGLSPDSIVITAKGNAKIPAFALASREGFASAADGRLHDYDAPEEARGLAADERSDIYSVGAVLYEMLTTRRPMHKGAAAPSAINPHVPKELDEVVLRAIAPNPDSRPQSAAILAADLRSVAAIIDERGILGDEPEIEPSSPKVSGVLTRAVIILLALALIFWWFSR